ncbi:MAG TPA: hypothetical protein P5026_12585 [Kiritimatiellia bacterium]|nr:hypothetical protein [Kiritimatiellia bacterium]HRU71604.1 hypothetical protein [Kiritimatiellia bacterium]
MYASRGCDSCPSENNEPRLIPLAPLLSQIPLQRPELTWAFYGVLPEAAEAYEWEMEVEGRPIPVQRLAAAKRLQVSLSGLACGDYRLRASLRRKQDGGARRDFGGLRQEQPGSLGGR